ncbi:MAG: 3-oxoacyl-ACP synthase [Algibacter sp.]|uniref:3-oxoacyl-ACP synthase n=1 Tax=Algibacter sp. TaxID=1872428 RepID=UPI002603927C|nr:3-oxoacyl-ACP synthase [Algibacter sp.]MDG1730413.1 3-oxoacyl-ACP synthase [Algibacter sp.]MDG2177676.1 3-oxoacyl-ACP synthase [Algibacter sp.]
MTIKQELYKLCLEYVENRFQTIQNTIKEIQESLGSETKSSAGDKHETGRAMLQLEREKAGNQLAEIQKLKVLLNKVNPEITHQKVALGSVVYTTQSNYFIAISAGEIVIASNTFYAVSAATPMAQLLLSKTVGDEVLFRNGTIKILKIL